MRKRLIDDLPVPSVNEAGYLPIETVAQVEVTSEAADAPIESAFIPGASGWQAGKPGEQRIRILFDHPQQVRRLTLKFVERERSRTQEFVLTWSAGATGPAHEIVRQQWNFSPTGTTIEEEAYNVELDNVAILELKINPDIGDRTAVASLAEWRVFPTR